MEDMLVNALSSGNATAILGSLLVYLIIHIQRRNATTSRDKDIEALKKDITDLQKENELKQKDITYLMQENSVVKEDLKEIKGTLNQMAISLAEIAAQAKLSKEKRG